MIDRSKKAKQRRDDEAIAATLDLNVPNSEYAVIGTLAGIYHEEFQNWWNTHHTCPNCGKEMTVSSKKDLLCSCDCGRPHGHGRWVMYHSVFHDGEMVHDYQMPLWEWMHYGTSEAIST